MILLNRVSPVVSLPLSVCNLTPLKSPVGPAPKRVISICDGTPLAVLSNRVSKLVTPTERAGASILPLNVAPLIIKLPVNDCDVEDEPVVIKPFLSEAPPAFNANEAVVANEAVPTKLLAVILPVEYIESMITFLLSSTTNPIFPSPSDNTI